jgi:hypothetical protein
LAHSQELIPLEQYVQQYFRDKAAREAQGARMPEPKPTPLPEIPPYPNILAPYKAPSLLDAMPRRDHQPFYVRPEIEPTPAPALKGKPVPRAKPAPIHAIEQLVVKKENLQKGSKWG